MYPKAIFFIENFGSYVSIFIKTVLILQCATTNFHCSRLCFLNIKKRYRSIVLQYLDYFLQKCRLMNLTMKNIGAAKNNIVNMSKEQHLPCFN